MGEVGRGSQPLSPSRKPWKDRGSAEGGGAPVSTVSTASTGRGAPVMRNVVRPVVPMLTVREVAAELAVCRATVYALLERGNWSGCGSEAPSASRPRRWRPSSPMGGGDACLNAMEERGELKREGGGYVLAPKTA